MDWLKKITIVILVSIIYIFLYMTYYPTELGKYSGLLYHYLRIHTLL